jgi:hypothetical protein
MARGHDVANDSFEAANCPEFVHKAWEKWLVIVYGMDTTNRTLLIAFNIILLLSTTFLNALSVVTIRSSPQLNNKLCYFVILLQSAVDFVVGVASIPLFIVYLATPLLGIQSCIATVVLIESVILAPAVSSFTLAAITAERYIGVLHPYAYRNRLTERQILTYASASSLYSLVSIVLSTFVPGVLIYSVCVVFPALFVFTAYAYTRIYLVVRRLDNSQIKPAEIARQNNGKRRRLLREIKHAKSCFIVVVCFAVCLMPTALGPFLVNHLATSVSYASYGTWTITLHFLNSNFTSMIFFWSKKMLRKEAIAILNSTFLRRRGRRL